MVIKLKSFKWVQTLFKGGKFRPLKNTCWDKTEENQSETSNRIPKKKIEKIKTMPSKTLKIK